MSTYDIRVIKAANGWLVTTLPEHGSLPDYTKAILVPEDGDLGGTIAAELVAGRLHPTPRPNPSAANPAAANLSAFQQAKLAHGLIRDDRIDVRQMYGHSITPPSTAAVTATQVEAQHRSVLQKFRETIGLK